MVIGVTSNASSICLSVDKSFHIVIQNTGALQKLKIKITENSLNMMRGLDNIENVLDKKIPTTSFERNKEKSK
jgi:hypothetical protein